MTAPFDTPQDAEDAYYDAIDEGDLEAMMAVWEASEEILCLLPMMPAQHGPSAIHQAWQAIIGDGMKLDIEVKHLSWIESGDLAIHLIEERVAMPGQPQKQSVYATNTYRKGADGWRILVHQNSPVPLPPEMMQPDIA
ncbi:YybH family protein [Candidatus Endoriftia persephonae]|jgi:ketosteroid isomerase-like protein|uniref:Alternative dihydrofolate reductase 3 n=2 Tax=Gammaproteobacteria TaxID=1236 RepID=G2FBQ4_9GAMM|nr:nuclear transport factor 2 family protein [Candidatus Endoriftia persephone]EGW55735.1 alternative dihydrofolate reductase 3 [endosymbiont of Tevnia jerichonana (vent Tica)]USF86279.1 nuclear transport factor 2 family protein [Candidatus Endoriftia persephone]